LPEPRPVHVDPLHGPPPPGGPVSTTMPTIDVGEPPPPAGDSISIETVSVDIVMEPTTILNREVSDGISTGFFTGIGSDLKITPRDKNNNPVNGITVSETVTSTGNRAVTQRQTVLEITNGSISDLVGFGITPMPTSPVSLQTAQQTWANQVETPNIRDTTQTLKFYGPGGYLIGTATYRRILSNVDPKGNLRPYINPATGRGQANFTIYIGPVTYKKN